MVNISDRWAKDKTNNLQFAFLNGVGWESWENIWGIWNGITPRDAEATRRMVTIERAVAPFLVTADWEPLSPMRRYGVFASRWPAGDQTLWTIVNRNQYDVSGQQIDLPAEEGMRYFDLYHGAELQLERDQTGRLVLSFEIEAHGFGALRAAHSNPDAAIPGLMSRMKVLTAQPLATFPDQWQVLPQQIVPIASTKPPSTTPAEMVKIPAGQFSFRVSGIEIEGFNDIGVDVQYPWENSPRFHDHPMEIKSFWINKYPVTNVQFKKFLAATHYRPADDLNFLRDWKDGNYPAGWDNKPVTWVSQEDARAYAVWRGSVCRTNGSGSMRRRELTSACILGEATWTRRWFRCLITAGRCAARMRWMLIPAAPVLLASWTWWATSGSGPKNSSTSTREEASCAAEATTSRKVPSGISLRPIETTSTENYCSWPRAKTAREPWDFAV